MYTWNYKPNEYGKITAASIQELKEKTNALVCSSVNSTYCVTHHYNTSYSGNSTQYTGDYSTNRYSQNDWNNDIHDGTDYSGYNTDINYIDFTHHNDGNVPYCSVVNDYN